MARPALLERMAIGVSPHSTARTTPVPIRENGLAEAAATRRFDLEHGWSAVARVAAACAACLRRRRADIHVSDVSEQWLVSHAAETPKHDEEVD